jgi:hypothetical protein
MFQYTALFDACSNFRKKTSNVPVYSTVWCLLEFQEKTSNVPVYSTV